MLGDVLAMRREHRVAGGIGRNRHEKMRDPVQRFPRQRWSRSKTSDAKPRLAQRRGLVGGSAGAADDPALGGEPAGQHPRGVAETEAEKMRAGHDGVPAAAGTAAGRQRDGVGFERLGDAPLLEPGPQPKAAGDERADGERQAQAEMPAERAHQHRADRRAGAEDHPVERHDPAAHPDIDRGLDQGLRADPGDRHRGAGDKDAGQGEVELVRQR